jgi:hypothetical protein
MSEQAHRPEQEPQPREVTGIFRLNVRGVALEFSPEGRAYPAGGEPRFAVKDIMVAHTTKGWAEFAEKLTVHLGGVESELFRGMSVYATAESQMPKLTDDLAPGEIHLVTQSEYVEAYREQYGEVIQGPFVL